MRVKILLFARLKELAGNEAVELELPPGTSLSEAWRHLQEQLPALRVFKSPPLMARNLELAPGEEALGVGDEIAFFPPVSGG